MNAHARGPHLAATGVTFDVIAVDAPLGLAALRLLREREVAVGAVILDRRWHRVGILVPPQTVEPVPEDELRCGPRQVGLGAWVVMPTGDPDATVAWLRPPAAADGIAHHLTPTRIVREAIRDATTALTEEEPQP
ncbi:hypothetical protein [Streptomyces sp. SID3343]|uniref:hypothetical protein n=1 Tax=Streptomyces sp. SID3343 TaxID=2690260 RepID=UPI00136EC5F9|nr:hypothetical protein [Streptomyces sp. SID3343]MYW00226.1 hypothetical protein [Streptomyces sp. SID3343]